MQHMEFIMHLRSLAANTIRVELDFKGIKHLFYMLKLLFQEFFNVLLSWISLRVW